MNNYRPDWDSTCILSVVRLGSARRQATNKALKDPGWLQLRPSIRRWEVILMCCAGSLYNCSVKHIVTILGINWWGPSNGVVSLLANDLMRRNTRKLWLCSCKDHHCQRRCPVIFLGYEDSLTACMRYALGFAYASLIHVVHNVPSGIPPS